ncbi:hypothetical protein DFH06DRAFT_1150402 [Mycena polygramma]|nr:hypothetical protein DFH06DRAFT_1150402 [Mycena polygramma]
MTMWNGGNWAFCRNQHMKMLVALKRDDGFRGKKHQNGVNHPAKSADGAAVGPASLPELENCRWRYFNRSQVLRQPFWMGRSKCNCGSEQSEVRPRMPDIGIPGIFS